jgi:hypothetical protein
MYAGEKTQEWYVGLTKGILLAGQIEEPDHWLELEGLSKAAVVPWKGWGEGA